LRTVPARRGPSDLSSELSSTRLGCSIHKRIVRLNRLNGSIEPIW